MALNSDQIEAAQLYARGIALADIADRVGVLTRTLNRWIGREDFIVYVNKLRAESEYSSKSEMLKLVPRAISTLKDVLDDTDNKTRGTIALKIIEFVTANYPEPEPVVDLGAATVPQETLRSITEQIYNVYEEAKKPAPQSQLDIFTAGLEVE
jgi:hypothetical protein